MIQSFGLAVMSPSRVWIISLVVVPRVSPCHPKSFMALSSSHLSSFSTFSCVNWMASIITGFLRNFMFYPIFMYLNTGGNMESTLCTIDKLFEALMMNGGMILSTASLSQEQIDERRAAGYMYVDSAGFGFVWILYEDFVNGYDK